MTWKRSTETAPRTRTAARWFLCVMALTAVLPPGTAGAHELIHRVIRDDGVTVVLTYPDGSAFSKGSYDVFGPGDTSPYRSGRTDDNGRIHFVPDRPGSWRVRVFSADGHGVDISVDVDDTGGATDTSRPRLSGVARILVGLLVIAGVFGILSFFVRRKNRRTV